MTIFTFEMLDRLVIDPHDARVAQMPKLKHYSRLRFSTVSTADLMQFVRDSYAMALARQDNHSFLQLRINQWEGSAERLIEETVEACIEKQRDHAFCLSHLNFAMSLGVNPDIRLKSQDTTIGIGRQVRFADIVSEQMRAGIQGHQHGGRPIAMPKQTHLDVFHQQAVSAVKAMVKHAAGSEIALKEFAQANESGGFMEPMEFFALLSTAGVTRVQFLKASSSGVKRQTLESDLGV